jgi:hypothetical protein
MKYCCWSNPPQIICKGKGSCGKEQGIFLSKSRGNLNRFATRPLLGGKIFVLGHKVRKVCAFVQNAPAICTEIPHGQIPTPIFLTVRFIR